MLVKIAGRVRGLFSGNYPENREEEQAHINNRGDLIVAQGLPEKTEIVRMGDSWQVSNASGITALTALPTTTAALSLWNGEPASGKCYVIDSVAVNVRILDVTQPGTLSLFAMMNKTPVGAPSDAGLVIRSLIGKTYGGKARTLVGGSVTNDGWFPCGSTPTVGTVVAGAVWKTHDIDLRGFYIIPPGGMFSLHSAQLGGGSSGTFHTIRFHEVVIIYKS
jgi:hypothetical protein